KADPAALGVKVPKTVRDRFPGFENVFERYGAELYVCARVGTESNATRDVVRAFLDLYAYERGWQIMQAAKAEFEQFHAGLRKDWLGQPAPADVYDWLRVRGLVAPQGPPGRGKSRMADETRRQFFGGRGLPVHFPPAVTYEDFIVGL